MGRRKAVGIVAKLMGNCVVNYLLGDFSSILKHPGDNNVGFLCSLIQPDRTKPKPGETAKADKNRVNLGYIGKIV